MAGLIKTAEHAHWGTMPWLLPFIPKVLGGSFLDPCGHPRRRLPGACKTLVPTDWRRPYPANGTGLQVPWLRRNYVNPPYGRALDAWWAKSVGESERGNHVLMLCPSLTGRIGWHTYVKGHAALVVYIKGRQDYVDLVSGKSFGAGFNSALILWSNSGAIRRRMATLFAEHYVTEEYNDRRH